MENKLAHSKNPSKQHISCCHTQEQQTAKKNIDVLFWGSLLSVATLFILAAFFADWISAHVWLETMANTAYHMIHTMWWGVVIGAIFVGLLSKIPREFIMSILGKGGTVSGLLRATGAGVLLDLCSHGILIVAAKLYERGASAGQVIAFLLASPWNSFSLTLVLIGLIGIKWTALFIILSTLIALITGWIFDRLVAHNILPNNHYTELQPEYFNFWSEAKSHFKRTTFDMRFFKDIVISGIKDSKIVVRWLLFGILLAAILRAALDPSQFAQFFGPSLLGLGITIFIATVLEVCSEGSAPIAADILNRAQAPGNGFAFLMAGVATDYTEVMVLKDTTNSWKLALFLPLITVPQVLFVAWIINSSAL